MAQALDLGKRRFEGLWHGALGQYIEFERSADIWRDRACRASQAPRLALGDIEFFKTDPRFF